MAFSKLQQQSTSQTKMELIAAQAKILELSKELSEAHRRSPSSESTSSSLGKCAADQGVEDLIRDLRHSQEELRTAVEAAEASTGEAEKAKSEVNALSAEHTVLLAELSEARKAEESQRSEMKQLQEAQQSIASQLALARQEIAEVQKHREAEGAEARSAISKLQQELAQALAASSSDDASEAVRQRDALASECEVLREEARLAKEEASQANARAAAASRAWGR
mmetsp:Transcript_56957/g.117801  ORF Transcript_56957/g.117801 Transcript_56957/m.117801 type:complete len:224 (-) Transcript_56957:100-771(-)